MTTNTNLKGYKFNELSDDAKFTVQWKTLRNNDVIEDELESSFDQLLSEKGYDGLEVEYNLSHSQGDGVAFYGVIDLEEWLNMNKELIEDEFSIEELESIRELIADELDIEIYRTNTLYHHWNTMGVVDNLEWVAEDDKELEKLGKKIVNMITLQIIEVSVDLEREGYTIIDDNCSESNTKERCDANDCFFTADGQLI